MKTMKITKQYTARETESISLYFQEVLKLTKEENLTLAQELDLAERIKKGDKKAETELIHKNLKFVITVAKHYKSDGCEIEDLINEGNYGLIKAARKYDSSKQCKFISYAVWWIRQSILCYISDNSKTIRLPVNKTGQLSKIKAVQSKLEQELQRNPTLEEVLDALSFEENDNSLKKMLMISKGVKSLNAEVYSGGNMAEDGFTLEDSLINDTFPSAYEDLDSKDLKMLLNSILNKLPEKHKKIIELYYGLNGNSVKNIEEISKCIELTKERIRQILKTTLMRIKKSKNKKILEPYI